MEKHLHRTLMVAYGFAETFPIKKRIEFYNNLIQQLRDELKRTSK
jgi:hypothetical protein